MPGTDICIKLGGYVRWQLTWNPGSSITAGPFSGTGGRHTRVDSLETRAAHPCADHGRHPPADRLRHAAHLHPDGLLAGTRPWRRRTSPAVYMTRGFIQIAGFTFGKATSFFDIVPGASFAYNAGMFHTRTRVTRARCWRRTPRSSATACRAPSRSSSRAASAVSPAPCLAAPMPLLRQPDRRNFNERRRRRRRVGIS